MGPVDALEVEERPGQEPLWCCILAMQGIGTRHHHSYLAAQDDIAEVGFIADIEDSFAILHLSIARMPEQVVYYFLIYIGCVAFAHALHFRKNELHLGNVLLRALLRL